MNRCPSCNGDLVEVEDTDPDSAPWVCHGCSRAWWPSQLEEPARELWDRKIKAYRPGPEHDRVMLHALVDRDHAREARKGKGRA